MHMNQNRSKHPVIPRVVAESMQRLDSATTLRYAQNDDSIIVAALK